MLSGRKAAEELRAEAAKHSVAAKPPRGAASRGVTASFRWRDRHNHRDTLGRRWPEPKTEERSGTTRKKRAIEIEAAVVSKWEDDEAAGVDGSCLGNAGSAMAGAMKFREIVSRVTGFSTPVFGVSWNPPEAERAVVKRVVAFLEDRRVLYSPSAMEIPEHCVRSVIEIRGFLTGEIGKLEDGTDLANSLRALRAACRKFLDATHSERDDIVRFGASAGHWASWVFNGALGELRGIFGAHLAILATKYGVDVEWDLANILPGEDGADEERRGRR